MNRSSSLMQAAVILNSLPKQQAAKVLSRLELGDIKTALDAVKRLDNVSALQLSQALDRLTAETQRWRDESERPNSQEFEAQQTLEQALAIPRTPLEQAVSAESPFKFLIDVIPVIRGHLLQDEHPKNIAIVLSMLPPDVASETMKGLDPALRLSVLKRICEIDELHPEEVAQLSFALKLRLKQVLNSRQTKTLGVDLAAKLLSCSDDQTQESLITHMGQTDPELAAKLQRSVFKIERLETMSSNELRTILKSVDTSSWAPALKNASSKLKSRIFDCMAAHPAELLAHEIEQMGHVEGGVEDVARQNIIQVVLRLAREGKIELRKNGPRTSSSVFPAVAYDAGSNATSSIS
ncbi:MAG: flagellar motor switch protein FliG [Mariniblastus sp.]|jgi:flagellar motor switch protein FliG